MARNEGNQPPKSSKNERLVVGVYVAAAGVLIVMLVADLVFLLKDRYRQEESICKSKIVDLEAKLEEAMGRRRKVYLNSGFVELGNGLLFKRFTDQADYKTAKEKCHQWDARLASSSIRNSTTRREISNKIQWDDRYVWIGLEDSKEDRAWFWSDGQPYTNGDTYNKTFKHESDSNKAAALLHYQDFRAHKKTFSFYYVCETVY